MKPKIIITALFLGVIFVPLFLLSAKEARADTFSLISDFISTSRPSSSTPLNIGNSASVGQVIVIDNGSRFIASDSATFKADTGETQNIVTVASMSAQIAGTPNTRIVYFTSAITNTHHTGDAVVVPITAMHTITFNTVSAVPIGGTITITFPTLATSDANVPASPSASTFQLNGITDTQVKVNGLSGVATFTGTYTNPSAGTSPTILLTLTGNTTIAAATTVTVLVGCTANTGAACTTQAPRIINPAKTAAAGTADIWAMTVKTRDVVNSTDLDFSKIRIGTIDSVEVFATVDPTFTFSIGGIANGAAVNTGNTTGCTNTETINTGFASTVTEVNLGVLGAGVVNRSAQLITITTNAPFGYSLTATASGHLIDTAIGYWLKDSQGTPTAIDTPVPAVFTEGTTGFGIHTCGLDVGSAWATGATGGGAGAKYANPSAVYYYSLASDGTGPIGNSIVAGNGLVTVQYGATVSSAVPAGIYHTALTYVATPSF